MFMGDTGWVQALESNHDVGIVSNYMQEQVFAWLQNKTDT